MSLWFSLVSLTCSVVTVWADIMEDWEILVRMSVPLPIGMDGSTMSMKKVMSKEANGGGRWSLPLFNEKFDNR